MLYAICYMLYAICYMLYAICYMLYAIYNMLYAICSFNSFSSNLFSATDNPPCIRIQAHRHPACSLAFLS